MKWKWCNWTKRLHRNWTSRY